MSTLKKVIQTIERAISSPKRNLMISMVLVLVGIMALMVGNWRVNRAQIKMAYGDGIVSVVSVCAQAISKVFGEEGIGSVESAWRGLRVYEPGLGQWVEFDVFDTQTLGERVVVLIHGLDEPGGIWDDLTPALIAEGHTVLRFEYANDQAIRLSATSFLRAIDQLASAGVESMDLVCHSMGGLVARDAITRDEFASKGVEVDRLVTLGTPHGGSPWARLRAVAEIREQVQRWVESEDLDPKRLMGFVRDGVGQAGSDLLPGSDFFIELNSRSLPTGVVVTCVVARTVPEPGANLGSIVASGMLVDLIGKGDAAIVIGEIEKLSQELGDGVVPMSSAVLDGVEDVVVVQANHRSMIRSVEIEQMVRRLAHQPDAEPPPGIGIVLDRLRRP